MWGGRRPKSGGVPSADTPLFMSGRKRKKEARARAAEAARQTGERAVAPSELATSPGFRSAAGAHRSSPSLPPRARRQPMLSQMVERVSGAGEDGPDDMYIGSMVADRYEIEAQFSEGGVGLLYRAHDHKLGREVAVKVMREELSNHSALRPRFEQEAGALVALGHPNIVAIHDYGHMGDCPYIVMALLRGQTLRRRLDEGPLDEAQAFDILRQLLRGLAYAHDQGVAHRDLKPSNIFLQSFPTQPDVVKMLDFGFAAFLDGEDAVRNDLSDQDLGFGTPAYMPPEQLRGQLAQPQSDVYAVGLVLFELLTGKRPYEGDTRALMRAQLRQPLPELSERNPQVGATEGLRALLRRATEKDPAARYPNAAAMLEAVDALPRPATFATAGVSGERPVAGRADAEPDAAAPGEDRPVRTRGRVDSLSPITRGFARPTASHGLWWAAGALVGAGLTFAALGPGGGRGGGDTVAASPVMTAEETAVHAASKPPPAHGGRAAEGGGRAALAADAGPGD